LISGTVFQDNNNDGIQNVGEVGIASVQIVLTGTDIDGNAVQRTVFTDTIGAYVFNDLVEGTYEVRQIQPAGFDDGIDSGAGVVGNDVLSNIQLGAGQVVTGNTFGEVVPVIPPLEGVTPEGVTGNPPRLPGFIPANLAPIGNQVSFASPGPIYSGIPINQNSDPLSLDSGRRVLGGYSVSNDASVGAESFDCGCEIVDCGCGDATPVDACGNSIMAAPVEQVIEGDCGCGPVYSEGEVPMGAIEGQPLGPVIEGTPEAFFEGASTEEGNGEQAEQVEEDTIANENPDHKPAPTFLKRFSSWMSTNNNIES